MFKLALTFCIAIDPPNLLVLQARLAVVAQSLILRSTRLGRWLRPASLRTCLYFAMAVAPAIAYDIAKPTPLLLYVGETEREPKQRWMNHYCYNYIGNYIEMHGRYSLDVAVGIAFWLGASINRKQRLKLESELIYRWRSPFTFNKEFWQWWGQPFGS